MQPNEIRRAAASLRLSPVRRMLSKRMKSLFISYGRKDRTFQEPEPRTTPPKTSTTKTSNSTTKALKSIAALHPEHNIASPQAVNKPISASQPASKVTRGSVKNKNKKIEELGCDLFSQKSPSDTPLEASQPRCHVCPQSTSTDTVQVTALRGCLCVIHIHGRCLDIKNPSLLDFLYVVSEVGGWCCPGCRSSKNNVKTAPDNKKTIKKTISVEQVNDELQFIKTQLASLTDALASNLDRADPPAPLHQAHILPSPSIQPQHISISTTSPARYIVTARQQSTFDRAYSSAHRTEF